MKDLAAPNKKRASLHRLLKSEAVSIVHLLYEFMMYFLYTIPRLSQRLICGSKIDINNSAMCTIIY